MPKRLTTEQFIERAKLKHGDTYSYSKVVYNGIYEKVQIVCTKHGEFSQEASGHLKGEGCIKCAGKDKKSIHYVIEKGSIQHNNKYTYDIDGGYINCDTKIKIKCPVHGEFLQSPKTHLKGQGCPKCKSRKTSYPEQFIFFFLQKLGLKVQNGYKIDRLEIDIYFPDLKFGIEYDGVFYHRNNIEGDTKKVEFFKEKGIDIIKIRENGLVDIEGCYNIQLIKNSDDTSLRLAINQIISYINGNYHKELVFDDKLTQEDKNQILFKCFSNVIDNSIVFTHPEIAKQWHQTKNGDLKPEYFSKGNNTKLWWQCDKGHEYKMVLHNKGLKCSMCRMTTETFILKSKELFGDRFKYDNVIYLGGKHKVNLICMIHGAFSQTPDEHFKSPTGCMKCSKSSKKLGIIRTKRGNNNIL